MEAAKPEGSPSLEAERFDSGTEPVNVNAPAAEETSLDVAPSDAPADSSSAFSTATATATATTSSTAPASDLAPALEPATESTSPSSQDFLPDSNNDGVDIVAPVVVQSTSPVALAEEAQINMAETSTSENLPQSNTVTTSATTIPDIVMASDGVADSDTAATVAEQTDNLQSLSLANHEPVNTTLVNADTLAALTQPPMDGNNVMISPMGPLGLFLDPEPTTGFASLGDPALTADGTHATTIPTTLPSLDPFTQPLSDFTLMDPMNMTAMTEDISLPGPSESETTVPTGPPPSGFAKLEFPDGSFFMTTYAVELGRDMKAYKLAQQQAIEDDFQRNVLHKRSQSLDRRPETPTRPIRSNGPASVAKSFVSESGGIMGEDDGHVDHMSFSKRKKKKSRKSKSDESVNSQVERKNSMDRPNLASAIPATVDPNVTARLIPSAHTGDPNHVPLIPIHPANLFSDPSATGKGISRKHVKIAYNFETTNFDMHVMGRNGAFHDQQYYGPGSTVALHDRSEIQIAGVNFTFVLPSVPYETEQEELGSVSGRMSFTFEDGQGESIVASEVDSIEYDYDDASSRFNGPEPDLSDLSDDGDSASELSDDDEEEEEDDEDDEDDEEDDEEEEEEEISRPAPRTKVKAKPPPPKEPARRGRPPKNAQKAQQAQKATVTLKLKLGNKGKPEPPPKTKVKEVKAEPAPPPPPRKASKSISKTVPKTVSKTVSKTVPKEKTPEMKEASKEPAKEPAKELSNEPTLEPSAEPSKDPDAGKDDSKADKPVRVARDEALLNGEGVNIPELPAGYVVPPRKKGPGRPPKDGIMSKREKAQLIKQIKAEEHARRLGIDVSQLPRPEPRPKPPPRRNSKGEVLDGDNQEADGKSGDGEDKKPKIPRPPRSPSPEIRIEDYTEEQLQRPQCNYVILIHEAIKNSKTGALNLQQIYSAIERRWPFFKFRTPSNGWQSSVRHNLGQHDAFRQVEKDGKGWLWGIKEGVPIERERKKKATPPPQPPPPNPALNQYPYGPYPPGAPRPPGAPPTYQYQPPRPRNFVPPTLPQAAAGTPQTYSSPYDVASSRAGEGSNGAPNGAHGPPQYTPGTFPNRYPHTNSPHPHAPPSHTPAVAQGLSGARFNTPSPDLVETFRRVFIGTAQKQKDGMDLESATRIVDNAIRRVLHPERMAGIPAENNELSVAKAFETCLTRSQGQPRRVTPGEPLPTGTTAPPTNVAANAAITAVAPPSNGTTPTPVQHLSGAAVPSVASAQPAATAIPNGTPSPAPNAAQAQAQAQRPAGPAEANLISLLTGAGARPASPAVGATSTPAAPPASSVTPPIVAPVGVSPSPAEPSQAQATGTVQVTSAATTALQVSAPVAAMSAPTLNITTAPPPAIPAALAPVTTTTPPPASVSSFATPPQPKPPGPVPAPSSAAPLPTPTIASVQTPPAMPKPNGIPPKLNSSTIMHANGTASPLRPAVEPLTPPAGAMNALNGAAVTVAGVKRALEGMNGADEGDGEGGQVVKKARVEV